MSREPQIPRFAVHATALGYPLAPQSRHQGHLPEQEPEDVSLLGGADGKSPRSRVRLTPGMEHYIPETVIAEPSLCDVAEEVSPVFAAEEDLFAQGGRERAPTLVTWDEELDA